MLRSLLALGCRSLHEAPSARRALLSATQGSSGQATLSHGCGDRIISLLQPSAHSSPSRAETITRSLHTYSPVTVSSTPQHQYSTSSPAVLPAEESQILTAEILPPSRPDLVARFLALEMRPKGERLSIQRRAVIQDFQRHPRDMGSAEVSVAVWTHRIRELCEHFKRHKKHVHKMRQMEAMFHRRKRMLMYMRRMRFEDYCYTIKKLGLKDVYAETGKEDRYRTGTRAQDPDGDTIRRRRFNFLRKYRMKKTSLWNRLWPQLLAEDPAVVVK